MISYPHISPIAFQLGHLKVYWYGIMYLLSFAAAWFLGMRRSRLPNSKISCIQINDLIFYAAMGTLIGGRIGYVIFYNFKLFLENPTFLFRIWEGGMSFHGGLLGVAFALYLFAKKINQPFLIITDFTAPLVPIGIAFGRIGNFINGELPGRITTVFWGMIFPNTGPIPRHPSQLYECFFEGIFLFVIIWFYSRTPKTTGSISGLFLICYGLLRFGIEFLREPDLQLGFIAFNWLTMGQLLSLIMVFAGIMIMSFAKIWHH